jgi:hypothetical protein
MKLTNKFNLPQTFVNVLERPTYSKGKAHLSATELLMPPQIAQLRKTHWENLEEDVTDRIWAIFGTAIHSILELGKDDNHIIEQRLHAEVDGWNISGAIDLQRVEEDGIIVSDYKTTGAWAVMNEKIEWEQQLNVYKWLVETVKKRKVVGLQICSFIRDFSRHENKEGYPEAPVHMIDVPIWDAVRTEKYVRERLDAHRDAKVSADFGEELPLCSDEERWQRETVYAVKREGRKTAIKLFKTIEEATELAEKEKGYVETRKGEAIRCTGNYCGVAEWCTQYQSTIATGSAED